MLRRAGLLFTDQELDGIEVADFGLNDLDREGAQILTLINTRRLSVKLLVLFPRQTEPEHWHPPVAEDPGKEETIRMLTGTLYFYVPGDNTLKEGKIPRGKEAFYTSRKEMILHRNDQLTVKPGTKHWFQAGAEGAVLYSFSTAVRDGLDKFSDPNVVRMTKIQDAKDHRHATNRFIRSYEINMPL
jgi:D-lyxose ketol-isomerase